MNDLQMDSRTTIPATSETEAHANAAKALSCPRCGYDQRGVVDAWSGECPLEGTCAECGLGFRWAEVLVPEKFEPKWCIEFAPRWLHVPWACWGTFWRSLNPWWFWRRLQMSFAVRPVRLIIYCMVVMVAPWFIVHASVQSYLAVRVRQQLEADLAMQQPWLARQLASMQTWLQTFPGPGDNLSPEQVAQIRQQAQSQIANLRLMVASPPVIDHSYFEAIVEAVFLPWCPLSWGAVRSNGQVVQPYPAPNTIAQQLVAPNMSLSRHDQHHGEAPIATLILAVLLPVSFILLPVSRRRAKVRWRHLARITAYGAIIPGSHLLLASASWIWLQAAPGPWSTWLWQNLPLYVWVAMPAWWAIAINRHLKMPHAAAVAALLTLMIALLISPCLMMVFPKWLVDMVLR